MAESQPHLGFLNRSDKTHNNDYDKKDDPVRMGPIIPWVFLFKLDDSSAVNSIKQNNFRQYRNDANHHI